MKNLVYITIGAGIAYLHLSKKGSKLPPIRVPETSDPIPSPDNISGYSAKQHVLDIRGPRRKRS